MTTSDAVLPSPEPGEPSDVSVAIEAARALWENGETDEALRWFSRAAEAAEQAGNDRRALDLARAVADLKDGLATRSRGPAAPTPPPPSVAAKPGPRPPPPSARKSLPPTPPSMRPRSPEPSVSKSAGPPPLPGGNAPSAPPPPPAPPARSVTPPPARVEAEPEPAAPVSKVAAPAVSKAPVAPAPPATRPTPTATSVPTKSNDKVAKVDASGERLRVSVKSSVRDPNLLLVRVLAAGQDVPAGCHEAYISPAQGGIDLRSVRE
jgi:hypothetical protein